MQSHLILLSRFCVSSVLKPNTYVTNLGIMWVAMVNHVVVHLEPPISSGGVQHQPFPVLNFKHCIFGQGEGTQPDTGSCQLHSLHWHYRWIVMEPPVIKISAAHNLVSPRSA